MRHGLPAVLALVLLAGGCAPGKEDTTTAAVAPATAPPDAAGTLPPGAAGKIAADQVGKVSPVPAFQGGGAGWRVEIQATGGLRHSVKLAVGEPAQRREGTVVYQPLPPAAAGAVIILDGTLYDARGDRAISIKLARRDCTDAGGRVHQHDVQVDVDGESPLQGCGDLAMY